MCTLRVSVGATWPWKLSSGFQKCNVNFKLSTLFAIKATPIFERFFVDQNMRLHEKITLNFYITYCYWLVAVMFLLSA